MSVSGTRTRRAGAFDIRVVIATLFCVFGPILVGMGTPRPPRAARVTDAT